MIETLSRKAAMIVWIAIKKQISELEIAIKRPMPQGLVPDSAANCLAVHKEQLAVLGELQIIRDLAYQRVFDTSPAAEMHMASKSSAVTP